MPIVIKAPEFPDDYYKFLTSTLRQLNEDPEFQNSELHSHIWDSLELLQHLNTSQIQESDENVPFQTTFLNPDFSYESLKVTDDLLGDEEEEEED